MTAKKSDGRMSLAAMPCSACCGSGQRKGENEHEWETFMETCEACKGSGTLEIEDCPNCDNCGWYMVPDSNGEPTQEQCQWCYTVTNSRFNTSLPNDQIQP